MLLLQLSQVLGRVNRIGQTRETFVHRCVAPTVRGGGRAEGEGFFVWKPEFLNHLKRR